MMLIKAFSLNMTTTIPREQLFILCCHPSPKDKSVSGASCVHLSYWATRWSKSNLQLHLATMVLSTKVSAALSAGPHCSANQGEKHWWSVFIFFTYGPSNEDMIIHERIQKSANCLKWYPKTKTSMPNVCHLGQRTRSFVQLHIDYDIILGFKQKAWKSRQSIKPQPWKKSMILQNFSTGYR